MRVFQSRLLREMFGSQTEEVPGGWSNFHNEKFYKLYSLQEFIRVTKSLTQRWVGRVTGVGEIYTDHGRPTRREETPRKT
jgi:hypothetical protein